MKLLYATNNNSKIYNMKRRLGNLPVEIVSPKDLNIKLNVAENGNTAVENAIKKASTYYEATGISTKAGDSGLYIENIPEENQPGLFVRRVNGKELIDDEMIDYYTKLVDENGIKTIEIEEDKFILTSNISKTNHRGNPLDVMSIDPNVNKYYTEMSDEDFKSLGQKFGVECLQFISENILNKKKQLI